MNTIIDDTNKYNIEIEKYRGITIKSRTPILEPQEHMRRKNQIQQEMYNILCKYE
jgi:hypothetical protein